MADRALLPNARRMKWIKEHWTRRPFLYNLNEGDAAHVLELLGYFFHYHPDTSISFQEAMRYACSSVRNHYEVQRRHILRHALESNLGGILSSAQPWTVDVPFGFALSFISRQLPRGYQPPTLDQPFVVLRSAEPSILAHALINRRTARREPCFICEGLIVPYRAMKLTPIGQAMLDRVKEAHDKKRDPKASGFSGPSGFWMTRFHQMARKRKVILPNKTRWPGKRNRPSGHL